MNQNWQWDGSIDTANDVKTVMYCKWQVWTWSPVYWGQKSPQGAHVEKQEGHAAEGKEGIMAVIDIGSTGRESDGVRESFRRQAIHL